MDATLLHSVLHSRLWMDNSSTAETNVNEILLKIILFANLYIWSRLSEEIYLINDCSQTRNKLIFLFQMQMARK